MRTYILFCFVLIAFISSIHHVEAIGKAELAGAYIHVDVIEAKHTIKELDMPGVRGDVAYVTENGWSARATGLYGKEKDGEISNIALSFGRIIPIKTWGFITPSVGASYTNMETVIHFDTDALGVVKFRDCFKAIAPFIGIEGIYNICPSWRLCATIQYSWSHTKTNIKKLFSSKSDSDGPNYGLLVEYDVTKEWSVNFGVGYNESYSQERNGIRIRGMKLGLARWF